MNAAHRIGLMGGTFDPIHLGHLIIADEVRAVLDLDSVVFTVASTPALKGAPTTAGFHRLEMVRLATASNPHFVASPLEIERGGVSYTIDTVRALRSQYGDEAEIFAIVGTDAIADLPEWREPAALCDLVTFVLCPRPGYDVAAVRGSLAEAGLNPRVVEVPVPQIEISSTDIRRRVSTGAPFRHHVPSVVAAYIEGNGLYAHSPAREDRGGKAVHGASGIDTAQLAGDELLAHLTAALSERLTATEFTHTMNVGAMAGILAQVYGLESEPAYLAGILHDWDKCLDRQELLARAARFGVPVPPAAERTPKLLHAYTGAADLNRRYPQLSDAVIEAVRCHTIGEPEMSDLAMVVYVADLIEPGRDHESVDTLREMVGTVSLKTLFAEAFERTVLHLVRDRKMVHPDTIAVWNWLIRQQGDR